MLFLKVLYLFYKLNKYYILSLTEITEIPLLFPAILRTIHFIRMESVSEFFPFSIELKKVNWIKI